LKKIVALMMAITIVFIGASLPQPAQAEEWAYQDTVTVAAVNFNPVPGDRAANLEKIKDFTIKAANQGANIILFPEIALTGIFPPEAVADVAETIPGPSTEGVAKLAAQYNVYVIFGMVERDGDVFHNSAAVIGPTGLLGVYRKVHPIEFMEPWTTKGEEFPLFETPYGPIGVGICYDTYCFPEVARSYAVRGVRLFFNPTAFPNFPDCEDYREFYMNALGTRAVENQMFVVSSNIVGECGGVPFFGYSAIFGPKPGCMNYHVFAGPASETEEEIVLATLDLTSVERLPAAVATILKDRNPEVYIHLVSGVLPNGTAYTIIGICAAAALVFLGLWLWERKRKVS